MGLPYKQRSNLRKCWRMPRPVRGDECSGSKFYRQDILVLLSIFAETGLRRELSRTKVSAIGEDPPFGRAASLFSTW